MLARAVVHAPDLLVLDEPFSGLDASWQVRMVELLRHWTAQGRTLVLATHSPEYMDELLTHGLILHQGRRDRHGLARAAANFCFCLAFRCIRADARPGS
jgi:ABC-type multidrug transport system ATPase subunit